MMSLEIGIICENVIVAKIAVVHTLIDEVDHSELEENVHS
jgi:hypothetical protein